MLRFTIVILFFLIIDWYVFRTFRNQFSTSYSGIKTFIYTIYWLVPLFLTCTLFYILFIKSANDFRSNKFFIFLGAFLVLVYLPKLFILVFQFIEDITKLAAWITKKISHTDSAIYSGAEKISRSTFIGRIGLIIAAIPFFSILYGIFIGRFNFKINRITLYFDHLPKEFEGFKIAQFSDLHTGSLIGQQDEFRKAMEMINNEQADIIVFTGDMVNNVASELEEWIDVVKVLRAKNGKYSILGNHDYGDYFRWENDELKQKNLETLKNYHAEMGFKLLMNENEIFERNGEKIALLGVENWGEKPFPQHGRLDLAMENVGEIPFKILLSHDPTHWDYQVLGKTNIALTLSGHTHGMQMAFKIGDYSWSPVSLKYKRWRGLYTEKNQHLYVNIGLGYIAFPGRVGTDPEISIFELKTKKETLS
jgi:uncharacterized protein